MTKLGILLLSLSLTGMFGVGHAVLAQTKSGTWRLEVDTELGPAPFHLALDKEKAYIVNADERLPFDRVTKDGDSLHLSLDLFDAYISFKIEGDHLRGEMKKGAGEQQRRFPIEGKYGDTVRFRNPKALSPAKLHQKYEVVFGEGDQAKPALGVFEIDGERVKGSFLTSTGDYRYLQGNIVGDSLYLSNYLGNATLYTAKIEGDSLIGLVSGTSGSTRSWRGIKNDAYQIDNPYTMTSLKEGYDRLDFSFPDLSGNLVSMSDKRFENKVTLVEITGSWCPNCMDAAQFLKGFKAKHPNIEIVGLSFERSEKDAMSRIKHYVDRFAIDYPVLFAGKVAEASEKLPALEKVKSFPTIIVIDKKGKVRTIHTGFSGPATGVYYDNFLVEFTQLVEQLENETL